MRLTGLFHRLTGGVPLHAVLTAACLGVAAGAMPSQAAGMPQPPPGVLARQWEDYERAEAKPVEALQPFRAERRASDPVAGEIRLVSINPGINAWFLLELSGAGRRGSIVYHLENADPRGQTLDLTQGGDAALTITGGEESFACRPWADGDAALAAARQSGLPFAPLCGGRLYLRNGAQGARSTKETVAEFLRDNVWFGEDIVRVVRETVYKDAFLESSETEAGTAGDVARVVPALPGAAVGREARMAAFVGFDLEGGHSTREMEIGLWYPVEDAPGIYASAFQPGEAHPDLLNRRGDANPLDGVERRANVYLLAFDLSQFELGYELGTDHPRLDWSPRPQRIGPAARLPGPDGIRSPAPLVPLGMVTPPQAGRIAATFTGGFKREHGAFRFGDFAVTNSGHHYGFVVHGAILSKLQPGLATLYVLDDGSVGMKTWEEADNALLPRLRFARQNGLPIVERHPQSGSVEPGPMVRFYGPGNWSGSAETEFRTLRAGACLKWQMGRPFLIYAYFSSVTPSAMARTFQAYDCDYAMLLDMNALEHTYAALYTPREDGAGIEARHLVEGMRLVDQKARDGSPVLRFIGAPDNRDFFYLLRKEPAQ